MRNFAELARPNFKDRQFFKAWSEKAANFGLSDFESLNDCTERQKQLLSRFKNHPPKDDEWKALSECRMTCCALGQCKEGCNFGTVRQRVDLLKTGVPLLQNHGGPYWFVTIVLPRWEVALGQLDTISVAAATKWIHRRLSSLKVPGLLAIGGFEVSHNIELDGSKHWAGQVHLVVAGATKEKLMAAFIIPRMYRLMRPGQKIVHIQKCNDLPRTLAYSVKRLIHTKPAFSSKTNGRQNRGKKTPTSRVWAEADAWLMGLTLGARIVLFGCARRGTTIYAWK